MKTADATEPLLRLRNLTVRHGERAAVDSVSFDVPEKSLMTLVGPSGCGKTTLLRAIAGFAPPAGGEILIDGRVVASQHSSVPPEQRQVGIVFQDGALFPHLSVWENVCYGINRKEPRQADEALELVGLSHLKSRFPDQLSGGERQRVALARALAPAPRLILLDEPFASLDPVLRQRLRQEVRLILAKAAMTAILVTHDQEEALSMADTVAVMYDGQILQSGPPSDVYSNPQHVRVAELLGNAQMVAALVRSGRVESAFGSAACDGPDGAVQMLVSAEQIVVSQSPENGGAAARMLERLFQGGRPLDRVELSTGERLVVYGLPSSVDAPLFLRLATGAYPLFGAGGERVTIARVEMKAETPRA